MPRPSQSQRRRQELIPIVARAFGELGYRRATTALLAERCGVQENILYRLWPDKQAMFIAAIEYVYELSRQKWSGLLGSDGSGASPAERLLAYESGHLGEFGLYRIVFAGLGETDEPPIRDALRDMFREFHRLLRTQISAHRENAARDSLPDAELTAWALVGLGTMANIGRELGLLTAGRRRRLIAELGRWALDGQAV